MKEMIMWDKYDNNYREVVDVEVARGLESDLYEANNRINDLLDIVKQRDKIIDLMADDLVDDEKYIEDLADFEYFPEYKTKEEAIKYYEKESKNAKD